jgi:hypothetical protein
VPTKDEHVNKASENEAFASGLNVNSQASINWKLVVLFYTALHYVEAYLADALGQHGRSHTTRDNYVARETNLRPIKNEYGHLKFYGYNARYEPDQFTQNDVQDALNDLAQLKNHIQPLL